MFNTTMKLSKPEVSCQHSRKISLDITSCTRMNGRDLKLAVHGFYVYAYFLLMTPDHSRHNCSPHGRGVRQRAIATRHRLPAGLQPARVLAGVLRPREWSHVLPIRLLGRMTHGHRFHSATYQQCTYAFKNPHR